jgi:transcriptional regulator with XRE-family HTH domain
MITGEQVKAARKLLKWTQEALAFEAGITQGTVTNFETGKNRLSVLAVTTIQRALEAAGVEFTNGGKSGVRLKVQPPTIAAGDLNP